MFYISKKWWAGAAVAERSYWDAGDCNHLLEAGFNEDKVWEIAHNYKVIRNFRDSLRKEFVRRLRQIDIPDDLSEKSYDSFVFETRKLAAFVKHEAGVRPLSGASKLLWHRFPQSGFIYDGLARNAVMSSGLAYPFAGMSQKWGQTPADESETKFLTFAATYAKFFRPLISTIGAANNIKSLPMVRANRVIDKLLWISGIVDESKRNKKNWRIF